MLIALPAVVICAAILGVSSAAKLKHRAGQLRSIQTLVAEIKDTIRFTASPVSVIINELHKKGEYGFLISPEGFSNPTDAALYADFIKGLGSTDTFGQMAYCDLWYQRFSEAAKSALDEYNQKGKLYGSLGLCGGLAVALIII